MIRKIVGKFVKNFRKNVQKIEEKIDCVSERKPNIVFKSGGIDLYYDTYSKSLGIMNMDKDGEWLKKKDFIVLTNEISDYYTKNFEELEAYYETLDGKQKKEIIFLQRVIAVLGLGLVFNIIALVITFI